MKTIAIISQKGGAGKTTLAVHLAVAATLDQKTTAVIDLDPQASATEWGDSREAEDPAVTSAQASRLPKVLEAAQNSGADLVIIDTAPHSESSALAAARSADLVVIPCRPAIFDLRAIRATADLIELADAQACVVINATPARGTRAEEAALAISNYNLTVLPTRLGNRTAFNDSVTMGKTAQEYEPTGKAAREIDEVYKSICQFVEL